MIASEDDAVFFGIRLKNAPGRAGGNNNVRRRRGFNEPKSGADRHEHDEQDRRESSSATQSESLSEQSQNPTGTSRFRHKPGKYGQGQPQRQLDPLRGITPGSTIRKFNPASFQSSSATSPLTEVIP